MKKIWILVCFLGTMHLFAQKNTITYETHGKTQTLNAQNPFVTYFGEWTLKNDDWTQNWGYGTEQIKIPNHHTISTGINTKNTVISIIDGPEPHGQIFWSYNPVTKEVGHLSSFGDLRAGKGSGTIDANGNLKFKLYFEGEAKNTYRIYTYTWINPNEYELKSVQYDQNDQPTGLFYGGNFVRVQKESKAATIRQEILQHGALIRKAFLEGNLAQIRSLHHPDVQKALAYNDLKNGRLEVMQGLKDLLENFTLEFVENEVENLFIQGDLAIEQTRFAIKGIPKKEGESFLFQGRTSVTYIRYADSPSGWATIREIIQPYSD